MLNQTKLREVLGTLPVDAPEVEVIGAPPALIATVVSGSFAPMDEADRQEMVWKHLRTHLSEIGDLSLIEFVFTNAPGETGETATAAS
jgi:acid stress-induced BolA-like protein IbaG/YrbA